MILILGAIFLAGFTIYIYLKTGKPITQWFGKDPKSKPDSENKVG